jgi:hypothetical protein
MIAEIFGEKNIDRIRVFYILTLEYTDIHVLVRRYNEPTDEPQLYHIMLCQVYLTMSRIQTHNFSGDRN